MCKASSICLERQSLYLAVILNSILGGEGRSGWENIQRLTMWDFGEKPTASLTCSTARSAMSGTFHQCRCLPWGWWCQHLPSGLGWGCRLYTWIHILGSCSCNFLFCQVYHKAGSLLSHSAVLSPSPCQMHWTGHSPPRLLVLHSEASHLCQLVLFIP